MYAGRFTIKVAGDGAVRAAWEGFRPLGTWQHWRAGHWSWPAEGRERFGVQVGCTSHGGAERECAAAPLLQAGVDVPR